MKLRREDIEEARRANTGKLSVHFTEDLDDIETPRVIEQITRITTEGKSDTKPVKTRIEAIHAGLTRNLTFYQEDKLRASASTWLSPYNKPVLTHHNKYGEPVGRVVDARYIGSSLMSTGKGCVELECMITDPDAIEKVRDQRYMTVSIGAETDSVLCSICNTDLLNEGFCEHQKGERYDVKGNSDPNGELCYWVIGNLSFDEISFVNIPSDPRAMITVISESVTETAQVGDGVNPVKVPSVAEEPPCPKEKEGANLPTPEELEALISEAPEALKEHIKSLAQRITDFEAQVAENAQQIQTLTAERDQLAGEKETFTSEKATLDSEKAALTSELEALKTAKEGWDAERNDLIAQNEEVSRLYRESVVERIVDLRVSLGKDKAEDREEVATRFAERKLDSLLDTLNDLAEERTNAKPPATPVEHIVNPGVGVNKDSDPNQIEGKEKKDPSTKDFVKTMAGAFNGLGYSKQRTQPRRRF